MEFEISPLLVSRFVPGWTVTAEILHSIYKHRTATGLQFRAKNWFVNRAQKNIDWRLRRA